MALETKSASGAGSPVASPMAAKPAPNKPAAPPAPVSALASVPSFGGNRGGKKRADGLPPGSPQAIAADKEKDRVRKQTLRDEAAKLAQPPALPSAIPGQANPTATPSPGGVAGADPASPPTIPWEPEIIKKFTDNLIEVAEAGRVQQITGKAREARIPERVVKEISEDAHYPAVAKASLQISAPRVTAKWLNKAGVSAEYADELAFVTSLGAILIQGRKLSQKLDKLIELANQPQPARAATPAMPGQPAKITPLHP